MLIDLQLHSKYSDGSFSPKKLALMLADFNVKVASLTDHNSIAGQLEFRKQANLLGIKTVFGLELYVKFKTYRFNVLWYNYDINSKDLHHLLEDTQRRRKLSIAKALDNLEDSGLSLNLKNYFNKYQYSYLPINALVKEIWKVPKNQRIIKRELDNKFPREEEIISHYFYPKKGPKLAEAYVSFERIVNLKKAIGGQIIFAHPALHRKLRDSKLEELIKAGLDGLEILSPHHSYNNVVRLASLVKRYKLIASGGSDFHLPAEAGTKTKFAWQWYKIDSDYLRGINKIIKEAK
jgi:3',5'-nucleoside bisphosphate phosphatase